MRARSTISTLSIGLTLGLLGVVAPGSLGMVPIPTPQVAVPEPGSDLVGVGSDGADGVWFSDIEQSLSSTAYLAHYTPPGKDTTLVNIAPEPSDNGQVWGIAPGASGEEWFARINGNQLARIAPDGTITNTTLPQAGSSPQDLVVDRQGDVWFTERGHGCVLGRLTPTGTVNEYPLGGDCYNLTVDPDGNIWVALTTVNEVVKISAATGATLASYAVSSPFGIASLGLKIWVTEYATSKIAVISSSGKITERALPKGRNPEWMTAGPDGATWFTEVSGPSAASTNSGGIGRLTLGGAFSETSLPKGSAANGIAATQDSVYFTRVGPEPALMRMIVTGLIPQPGSYVALGDSYSSGEGNSPFEPESNDPNTNDTCHRSRAAYGPLLDGDFGLGSMTFAACSGAVTDDLFVANPNRNPTEPPQLSRVGSATKTVTLTIGGNDAGFVEVLKACLTYTRHFGCSHDTQLATEVHDRLHALAATATASTPPPARPIHSLAAVIAAINAEAPSARILIGGYPHLFGRSATTYQRAQSPSGHVCVVGYIYGLEPVELDYYDAQWLNLLGTELDSVIHNAVKAAHDHGIPAFYVEPSNFRERSNGHALCDTGTPWLNPLELSGAIPPGPEPGSFHPNASGQRSGYEAAFGRQIR